MASKINYQRQLAKTLCFIFMIVPAFTSADSIKSQRWVTDPQFNECLVKLANKKSWQSAQAFTEIKCHSENIQKLEGIEQFVNVTKLSIYNNKLREVQLAGLQKLKVLNLAKNQLQHVEITNLNQLEELYLFSNELQTLTLRQLPKLSKLKANSNDIVTFTYSEVDSLEKIYLFDNKMEHIDIYNLPKLTYMDVRQNPMPDKLYEEMDEMTGVTILHDGNADDWN